MLEERKSQAPRQAENIDAIIRYYQTGGELPTYTKIVYALNGKVARATVAELGELLRARNNPRELPYYDASAALLFLHPLKHTACAEVC